MTVPPDQLDLAAEFPAVTRQDWRELVRAVLVKSGVAEAEQADAPEDLLATRSYDDIPIEPLYAGPADLPGLPGLAPFTRGARPEGATATGWDVRARHADPTNASAANSATGAKDASSANNPTGANSANSATGINGASSANSAAGVSDATGASSANAAILADLEHGVTSLWLALPPADLPAALTDVLLDLAPVTLDAGADYAAAADTLLAIHAERGIPASEVGGNLGIDPIGLAARTGASADLSDAAAFAAQHAATYPGLRTIVVDALPFHEAGGSDAQELGLATAAGVAYLRALVDAGMAVETALGQLEFRFAVSTDQFAGIAKLRAARRLWARVAEVSGVTGPAAAQRQHAVSSPAMLTRRDPWVNMLRGTLACFAAGIGGADAVTVLPFDTAIGRPTGFSRRVARNTQAVLLEESRLAGVIDPAGGSWYVESLTESLAQKAWAVFTATERAGGILAELASGAVADRLAATRAARAANIATRTDPITGVSEFPNLAEPAIDREPWPAPPTGGLPRIRYAEDFEALRDRSDAALASTGHRPAVFLATLGPAAAHTARVGFAANLLQAGGLDTPTAPVADFAASGATIACLCGSDRSYADEAASAIAALKAAGAVKVLLAGPRSTGGADDYLYRGCDALAVLHRTWDTLEASR